MKDPPRSLSWDIQTTPQSGVRMAASAHESVARGGFCGLRFFTAPRSTHLGLLGFEPGRRATAARPAAGGQPFQAQDGFVNLFTFPAQVFQYGIQIHHFLMWRGVARKTILNGLTVDFSANPLKILGLIFRSFRAKALHFKS